MDELIKRVKNLFTMHEYGIITPNEYIEELNKIRKALGFEKLPVSQIAAQQNLHGDLAVWWCKECNSNNLLSENQCGYCETPRP